MARHETNRWGPSAAQSVSRWLLALPSLALVVGSAWAWMSWTHEAHADRCAGGFSEELLTQIAATEGAEPDPTAGLVLETKAIDRDSRLAALRALREVRITSRALSYIRKRYVESDREHPRRMLEAALQAVAHRVPEMLVDTPATAPSGEPLALRVRIGEAELRLDLTSLDDLFHLNWSLLKAMRFVAGQLPKDVPAAAVEYVAVNGMLGTLDPYSYMLDPEAYREMRTSTGGRFGGLGIRILALHGVLTIVSIIEGSPAERAGLKSHDQILQIDGEDTLNISLDESVHWLRGEVGSVARLTIRRKGWPLPREVVVVRAVIHLKSVQSRVLDNGVGYARIKGFQRGTAKELARALRTLRKKGGRRGLVLDLRGNPGGLLDEAIKVCDLLMDHGPVVITVAEGARRRDVRMAHADKTWRRLPVAVLVNNRSASASEIVTGALKYSGRAIVIGERTFGKGTVQIPYEIGAGALKLTVAKYLIPGDLDIQDRGVTPDVELRFLSARDRYIQLFDQTRARRARRRRWSRDGDRASAAPTPTYQLRPVLPDPRAKRAEGAAPPESRAQMREREPIRRAARLLRYAGDADAAQTLHRAQAQIVEMQEKDDQALIAQLMRAGVDWRAGPRTPNPRLRLELMPPPNNYEIRAGETLHISVRAHNESDQPLYRLHLITRSDDLTFDDLEQVIGRLEPGATREVELVARTSRRHRGVRVPVHLMAAQDGEMLRSSVSFTATLRPLARPNLQFRWRLDDGEPPTPLPAEASAVGDGFLEPKEEARLRVSVRNVGAGDALRVVARLRSLSGQRLHLEEGRTRLGKIKRGEEREAVFFVTGGQKKHTGRASDPRQLINMGLLGARLELNDEAQGYLRRQRLYLPWSVSPEALKRQRERPSERLTHMDAVRLAAETHWNQSPTIHLSETQQKELDAGLIAPLSGDCALTLRGYALFESSCPQRRFVTVTVGKIKKTYHAGHGKTRLDFISELRLDKGMNRVTIQAQAGPELSEQRRLYVHCSKTQAPPSSKTQAPPSRDPQETR